jgi:hypothetical protein
VVYAAKLWHRVLRAARNGMFGFMLTAASSLAGAEPSSYPVWDTRADTWVATDALDRTLPVFPEVGPPRKDRTVGIFYFLWHGPHVNGGPWDNSRIIAQNPGAMTNRNHAAWGPLHAPHHWGESIFGYYLTHDPYVLRKHAQMLSDAGVDVVIFDVTNQLTYRTNYLALLEVFDQVRQAGGRPPQVAFLCPFWDPASVVRELFRDLYAPAIHPELWFRWQGKPLILADPYKLSGADTNQLRSFFTFRRPQPDYFQGQTKPDMWSWLEVYPQHVFTNSLGQKEQMSVGVAQNAVGNRLGSMSEPGARGRSYHHGAFPGNANDVRYGYNLAEQFERAIKEDPLFIFITGWNEWIAGRFDEFAGVRYPVMFVDQFDQEHSRDIEPMKGGHGDNYYYQMIADIRRYKGVRPLPKASPTRTIKLKAGFDQWAAVAPEYRDDRGDIAVRNFPGWNQYSNFVNRTVHNDLIAAKVARDARRLYFYLRTDEAISLAPQSHTMWLLLDIDGDHRTGWEGYDLILNRVDSRDGKWSLERNLGGWKWQAIAEVPVVVEGNQLQLALPRNLLGPKMSRGGLAFDFKWADGMPESGDLVSWLDAGDCAPNARFNYRFSEK